jgi:hypothetical protein
MCRAVMQAAREVVEAAGFDHGTGRYRPLDDETRAFTDVKSELVALAR